MHQQDTNTGRETGREARISEWVWFFAWIGRLMMMSLVHLHGFSFEAGGDEGMQRRLDCCLAATTTTTAIWGSWRLEGWGNVESIMEMIIIIITFTQGNYLIGLLLNKYAWCCVDSLSDALGYEWPIYQTLNHPLIEHLMIDCWTSMDEYRVVLIGHNDP